MNFSFRVGTITLSTILCVLMSVGAPVAQAQVNQDSITKLLQSAELIEQAIDSSQEITLLEWAQLKGSLATIKTSLNALASTQNMVTAETSTNTNTAKGIGLTQAVITFDIKTYKANVKSTFGTTTRSFSFTATKLSSATPFNEVMDSVRTEGAARIADRYKITTDSVQDILFITGRNPIRDKVTKITLNSDEAIELMATLGRYSIIKTIDVFPYNIEYQYVDDQISGNKYKKVLSKSASVVLKTDQDETMNLTYYVPHIDDPETGVAVPGSVSMGYDILVPLKTSSGQPAAPKKIYAEVQSNATEEEIATGVNQVFFGSELLQKDKNYANKLSRFMGKNTTYSIGGDQCYPQKDMDKVTDGIEYLLTGLQYYSLAKIVKYYTPAYESNWFEGERGCQAVSSFF